MKRPMSGLPRIGRIAAALLGVLAMRGPALAANFVWDFAANASCAASPAAPVALCNSDYHATTLTFADTTSTYFIVARGYYLGSGTSPTTLNVGSTTWTISPAPTPNSDLWAKYNGGNEGDDETGLGIADPNTSGNREIEKNNFIQLDLTALPPDAQSVDLQISSLQSGETATVWGSSTVGQPGLLLASFVGPGAGGAAVTTFHYDLSAGRYLTVSANPNVGGSNNVLIQSGFNASIPQPTPTPVPTATPIPTATPTAIPTPTATAVPTPTATAVPTPTATAVPTPTATAAPTPTAVPTPTPIHTPTPAATSTALVPPTPGDVCHHSCPDKLRFGTKPPPGQLAPAGPSGKPDQLIVRSAIGPGATIDPNDPFTIVLSNANGVIFSASLQPGDLQQRGKALVFIDRDARTGQGTRGGLALVKIQDAPKNTGTRITVVAFGDMSAASVPEMTLDITVGDDANGVTATWEARPYGWLRPHH